ncbi:MAG: heparin lyase I family protein [Steroidobacteraceae bacterium]|nr:heparin lyase I family protein [Steroidobacteraceae bacterium]
MHIQRGKFVPGLALSALLAAPVALPAPNVLVNSDFESGVIDPAFWAVSGNAPTITKDVARSGQYALKTVLDRNNSKVSYRTELTSGGRENVTPGQDYWYGFSVYLPDSYVPDNIWEIVAQWHSTPDNKAEEDNHLNPPLSLHTGNGNWEISTIWDTAPITDKKHYAGKKKYPLGKYETGKWTDWVFHIKWSPNPDGLLQVWKDGKKVVDVTGPIGYNDQRGPYFKMGLYKGWKNRNGPAGAVTTRTLYHDEFKFAGPGGRYEDVAPGGGSAIRRPAPPQSVMLER